MHSLQINVECHGSGEHVHPGVLFYHYHGGKGNQRSKFQSFAVQSPSRTAGEARQSMRPASPANYKTSSIGDIKSLPGVNPMNIVEVIGPSNNPGADPVHSADAIQRLTWFDDVITGVAVMVRLPVGLMVGASDRSMIIVTPAQGSTNVDRPEYDRNCKGG